jgi:hypothetical protein
MSFVQFNLLPDSKLEYNRTQSTKHLVYTIAVIASIASFALMLAMLGLVDGVQKKLMDDSAKNVDKANTQFQELKIDKVITVQNQLQALPKLHQSKHITSRIFTYLPKVTPSNVGINSLDLDTATNKMAISGTAPSQKEVNIFIDTLKIATYKIGNSKPLPAFKNVVESGFSINTTGAGYSINLDFDPQLFANGLTDEQGKPTSPVMIVDTSTFNTTFKDPSSTLFNGSQTGAGQK